MNAVVIGAGAAGLYSALLLSRYGHHVTLLEAANKLAPLLSGFTRAGLQCDTGFHMAGTLSKGGALYGYLNFVDLLDHLRLVPYRRDCRTLLRFIDKAATCHDACIPQGTEEIIQSLQAAYPEHGKNIKTFFSEIENAYHGSPLIDPRRITSKDIGFKNSAALNTYFDANIPPKLRTLMTASANYYGVPPARAVFTDFALVAYSMQHAVHGVHGGGLAIVQAFTKELGKTATSIRLACKASSVKTKVDGSLATVVTENGDEIPCDFCIYTGHPAKLPSLLPDGAIRPSMRRHLASLEETLKLFIVFAATKSAFLEGRDAFICASEDINQAYADAETWLHLSCGTPDKNGNYPVFISVNAACAKDSKTKTVNYPAWKSSFTQAVLLQVNKYMPELSDLVLLDSASDYSMSKWVCGSMGSAYGAMHSVDSLPITPFTHVKGFVLAGQNILLPGLLGTFISAVVACASLIGYEKILRDFVWKNSV